MTTAKNRQIEDYDGYTLLMLKAEEGNLEQVNKILSDEETWNNINASNKNGYTALALAIKTGNDELIENLIMAGADVNIKNNAGQSPLFLSCWNNHQNIAELLICNGADVNSADQRGWTPLMIASYHGYKNIVKILLDNKADVNAKDCFGKRAINRTKDPILLEMLKKAEELLNEAKTPELSPNDCSFHDNSPKVLEEKKSSNEAKKVSLMSTCENPKEDNKPNNLPTTTLDNLPHQANPRANITTTITCNSSHKITLPLQDKPTPTTITINKPIEKIDKSSSPLPKKTLQFKEDLQQILSEELAVYTKKMQILLLQKTCHEVPIEAQLYEEKFRKELDSIFDFRLNQIAKSLQAQFNLKLKFCLNRLGYDTNSLDLKPFIENDNIDLDFGNIFTLNSTNGGNGNNGSGGSSNSVGGGGCGSKTTSLALRSSKILTDEIKTMENAQKNHKIQIPNELIFPDPHGQNSNRNTKKGVSHQSTPDKTNDHYQYSHNHHQHPHHPSYHHVYQVKNEIVEYVNQELAMTTKFLLEYVQNKINESMRETINKFQTNVMQDLNGVLDGLEDKFRDKFEEMLHEKNNELLKLLGHPQKVSPYTKKSEKSSLRIDYGISMVSLMKNGTNSRRNTSPSRISTEKMRLQNELDEIRNGYTTNTLTRISLDNKFRDDNLTSSIKSVTALKTREADEPRKEGDERTTEDISPTIYTPISSKTPINQHEIFSVYDDNNYRGRFFNDKRQEERGGRREGEGSGAGAGRKSSNSTTRDKINKLKSSLDFIDNKDGLAPTKSSFYLVDNSGKKMPLSILEKQPTIESHEINEHGEILGEDSALKSKDNSSICTGLKPEQQHQQYQSSVNNSKNSTPNARANQERTPNNMRNFTEANTLKIPNHRDSAAQFKPKQYKF